MRSGPDLSHLERTLNLLAAQRKPRKINSAIVDGEIFADSFMPVRLVGSHAETAGLQKRLVISEISFRRIDASRSIYFSW